jgi:predicted metal-dependent enzyme (double-stranded beta helix superfamily)
MGGGPFAPGPVKKMENHAMIGVILELEGGELVFVKMTGPKKTIDEQRPGVMKMIEGLKNK